MDCERFLWQSCRLPSACTAGAGTRCGWLERAKRMEHADSRSSTTAQPALRPEIRHRFGILKISKCLPQPKGPRRAGLSNSLLGLSLLRSPQLSLETHGFSLGDCRPAEPRLSTKAPACSGTV